jgi:hypothetical protein
MCVDDIYGMLFVDAADRIYHAMQSQLFAPMNNYSIQHLTITNPSLVDRLAVSIPLRNKYMKLIIARQWLY